jgi:hypothetical protein
VKLRYTAINRIVEGTFSRGKRVDRACGRSSCRKMSAKQIFQWNIYIISLVSVVVSAVLRGKSCIN